MTSSKRLLLLVAVLFFAGSAWLLDHASEEMGVLTPLLQNPLVWSESPTFRQRHHEHDHFPLIRFSVLSTQFRHWIFGGGLGLDLPGGNWNSAYQVGSTQSVEMGYAINKGWVMGVGMDFEQFSGSYFGIPLSDKATELHLMTRFFWGGDGISPYITAQAGGIWQTSTALGSSVQNFNPTGGLGMGVELGLEEGVALYGEALFDLVFLSQGTAWDVPISTGMRLKL